MAASGGARPDDISVSACTESTFYYHSQRPLPQLPPSHTPPEMQAGRASSTVDNTYAPVSILLQCEELHAPMVSPDMAQRAS
jgi:hypothetical protein